MSEYKSLEAVKKAIDYKDGATLNDNQIQKLTEILPQLDAEIRNEIYKSIAPTLLPSVLGYLEKNVNNIAQYHKEQNKDVMDVYKTTISELGKFLQKEDLSETVQLDTTDKMFKTAQLADKAHERNTTAANNWVLGGIGVASIVLLSILGLGKLKKG